MSSGLLGLFDDVAALAKLAAASVDDIGAAAGRASVKAAGVVVDDTAVTPAYVHGLTADRELPIIKRIAKARSRTSSSSSSRSRSCSASSCPCSSRSC
jgi:predicted DNA repair protein MutK